MTHYVFLRSVQISSNMLILRALRLQRMDVKMESVSSGWKGWTRRHEFLWFASNVVVFKYIQSSPWLLVPNASNSTVARPRWALPCPSTVKGKHGSTKHNKLIQRTNTHQARTWNGFKYSAFTAKECVSVKHRPGTGGVSDQLYVYACIWNTK